MMETAALSCSTGFSAGMPTLTPRTQGPGTLPNAPPLLCDSVDSAVVICPLDIQQGPRVTSFDLENTCNESETQWTESIQADTWARPSRAV